MSIFSIAPHAPFLNTLAARVLDRTLTKDWDISGPFGLADITIILPTNRARLALADAFAKQSVGSVLLPQIRTFGGPPEEEEPFLPPFAAEVLPTAITPLSRKLVLAKMVEAWVKSRGEAAQNDPAFSGFANPPSAAEILMLAESLGELIDDCLIQNVDLKRLRDLETGDNSAHWQTNLKFLEIALQAWPQFLSDHKLVEAATRRNLQLERQAQTASLIFGDKPVIAAGSTGSIPATANLLQAIEALPRGALVLPGLDLDLSARVQQNLDAPENAPHGHPQYGLVQLLNRLGFSLDDVAELAPSPQARTHIVRHALAMAQDTNDWTTKRADNSEEMEIALNNTAIALARTDQEQARAIALAARSALSEQKSVGIISPDRNLARRIVAELRRFDVIVDDSAGTPLFHSRAGRLVRQILDLARNPFGPVELVAVLRAPSTTLGYSRARITSIVDTMELALLRGQRAGPGLEGIVRLAEQNLAGDLPHATHRLTEDEAKSVITLLGDIDKSLKPLTELLGNARFSIVDFAHALTKVLSQIVALPIASEPDPIPDPAPGMDTSLSELFEWLSCLATELTGPMLSQYGLSEALESLMSGATVRAPSSARQDIAIWGLLEARLQNADLMILAGLSEAIWPETADPGPWLNRHMRMAMGLEPPERRQGQAAHDFAMAMGNNEVLITRAERAGTSPTPASRLSQRLEAFIGENHTKALHAKGNIWIERARDLDFAGDPMPVQRPNPCPPARMRPKQLSVTEIESLIRSPYDLYAKHVLKLRPLAPLGEDADLSERGTLVHAVLGQFIQDGHDPTSTDARENLMALARQTFAALDAIPERRILWTARFGSIATEFIEFEQKRDAHITERHAELSGQMVFEKPDVDFCLRGRADRIDERQDGRLEVLDFKTGAAPAPKDMNSFTQPQLLLEALIAREGGFENVPANQIASVHYLKLGFGPGAFIETAFEEVGGLDMTGAVTEIEQRLSRQIDAYLYSDTIPMSAQVFPNPKQRFVGDYDHLARLGEWSSIDGGEEGEGA